MKLNHRNWLIIDANGKIINVQGEGVVGEFPTLEPGECFEYTSGTPLKTTNGIMQGFYLMSQNNGEQLKIDIPAFSLDSPYNKKNLH
jgi:ApaG protein